MYDQGIQETQLETFSWMVFPYGIVYGRSSVFRKVVKQYCYLPTSIIVVWLCIDVNMFEVHSNVKKPIDHLNELETSDMLKCTFQSPHCIVGFHTSHSLPYI